LLVAVECNQDAVDEIDDARLLRARCIAARDDLRGHSFNFDSFFRREKLKLRGAARCFRTLGVLLSCQNGGPS
jgi:hypothetical protein